MPREQSYANHKRYFPLFHFIVVPLLALNVIATLVYAIRHPGAKWNWWQVAVALALAFFAWTVRVMVLTVQNRVVRLEETLRLQRLLPDDLRDRIGELRTSHLIALRFCADEELPEMCRAVLSGELRAPDEIKRRVKSWRPDWLRA
jgi:GAF domain-containing protein